MDTPTAQDSINKKCLYKKQIPVNGYILVWPYMHIWIIIVMRALFQGNFLILLVAAGTKSDIAYYQSEGYILMLSSYHWMEST